METAGENEAPERPRARYMLIFRGGAVSRGDVSPSVLQAHVEKWYAWADELVREGRRNHGTPLANRGKAVRGYERVVTDGPYAESKEQIVGYCIVDCDSPERAVEIAARWPDARLWGMEVRPILSPDGLEM
jgi:hypothetical protein